MTIPGTFIRSVETVPRQASARQAAQRMKETGVGALVVIDGDELVGLITDRDLALGVLENELDPDSTPVGELAHGPVASVRSSASLKDVVGVMRESLVRRVPIVDEAGALVGIVTADDLTGLFGDQLTRAVETARAGFDHEACPPDSLRSSLGRE